MNEAWRVFSEHEGRLVAPPHLEARVLAAVAAAPGRAIAGRRYRPVVAGIAAAVMVAVVLARLPVSPDPAPAAIAARAFPAAALKAAIQPERPSLPASPAGTAPIHPDWIAHYEELPMILMMFDFAPALTTEPLQLVRLRVPREALQGLGVALIEPDAAGMVDLDVLVGEDGLPRNIRKVQRGQEER